MSSGTLNDVPELEHKPTDHLDQPDQRSADTFAVATCQVSLGRRTAGKAVLVGAVFAGAFILSACGDSAPEANIEQPPAAETSSTTVAADPPKEDAPAAEEPAAEADVPEADEPPPPPAPEFETGNPAAVIASFDVAQGSLVFTVTVEGDGQALAESPDTQWYQPVFEFDTAEGSFTIDGTWAQGRPFNGRAFDENFKLIVDADITGEWTSPDTMVITADDFGSDELPALVRVLLGVRVMKDDGTEANFGDSAKWEQ